MMEQQAGLPPAPQQSGGAGGSSSSTSGWSVLEGLALVGGAAVAALGFAWWHSRSAGRTGREAPTVTAPSQQQEQQPARACRSCGKTSSAEQALVRCSRCRRVWYCSRECQRQDWARHKSECASAAATKPSAPALPAWASGLTKEEYDQVETLIKQNDEQFERHILQGGPRPDSIDDIWEDFTDEEKQQVIDDTIWYKEFYSKHVESKTTTDEVPNFVRRLAAIQFFASAAAAISFFSTVFGMQTEETLNSWVDHFAQDLCEHDWFRSSFVAFLRYANTLPCQKCSHKVLSILSDFQRMEASALLAVQIPAFVSDPLKQPLDTPQALEHLWAVYYATGNEAMVSRLILEGLPLGTKARAMAAQQPAEAQLIMRMFNYILVTLTNEGIFDEKVRKVCEQHLASLEESSQQSEIVYMLQDIIAQQQANTEQLSEIPAEEVRRMRVEVEGHRPFIERLREIKHQAKVARLKNTPGVRAVPSRFGQALYIPSSSPGQVGRLYMTLEE